MGKFKNRKLHAAALAAVLAVTAVPRIDLGTMQLASAVQSVLDFQQQLAAMQPPQTDAVPFVSLRYDAQQGMLYRDGKPVGDRLGEYAVIDGKVMLSAKAAGNGDADAGYVSLEQAAKQIGCTVTEGEDGVTITSPFDSACLIVRAEGELEQYGALDCVEYRDGLHVLQYATPADAYQAYQQFVADERVDFAEPSRAVALAAADASQMAYRYSTDEYTDWGVSAIGAESYNQNLIASHETLPEIVVAVVDTGIYYAHERFVDRLAGHGAAFLGTNSYTVDDQNGHGTHCAGIIVGATPDNVKILPVRALDEEGYGSILGIYCGMEYAMEQDADVVSMSLGSIGESPLLQYMVEQLYDADIPCCVAAGNESMDADNVTPARAEHAITVGAVDQYKELAYFSNYGTLVDVVAPGVDVYSAGIDAPDDFVYMSGTSMATPYVAACAAMVLSADETLSVDNVDAFLKANAMDLGEPGRDDTFGYGMVYMGDFVFDGTYCAAPEILYNEDDADTLGTVDITMSCVTDGSVIYYTLDGSTPDKENGILYTKPFTLNESALVKAASYLEDRVGGYSEAAICIGGEDVANALVVKDGVLVAYNGVLTELDLTERTDITAIGDSAFAGNHGMETVLLADTVTSIGAHAFEDCAALRNVEGSGVIAVGEAAFRNAAIWWLTSAPLETIGEAAFENCTQLVELFLSEELTEIPDRFLKNSRYSGTFALPKVTVIGDEAFVECGYIEFSEMNWSGITAVGKEAFRDCFLQGVYADFEALQTIGEGAFRECYDLAGITLPKNITKLPAYLLANVGNLEYLKAPGVTTVEDFALALHAHFDAETIVEIPFAQITTVGRAAFEGFIFRESATFTALTEMGQGAFSSAKGGMLSFPSLKQVPAEAFVNAQNPVLYFENATTIGEDAFGEATSIVVLSDACTAIADTAFVEGTIAAPAQSEAAKFAQKNDILYIETPTVYAAKAEYTFNPLDAISVEGYGLGFGMQYQWYDAEGNAIAGATDYIYNPAMQQNETEQFTLRVTDAEGNLVGALDYTVTVRPVEIAAKLTADTVILSDYDSLNDEWDTVTSANDYDYNFSAYRYYSFTPDADGIYYFHLSDLDYIDGASISLLGADLEQCYYDTTKYLEADLTAGETYIFVIHYTDQSVFAGALGVSTTAPDALCMMAGSWWMDADQYSSGIVPEAYPYVPELQLFNPNYASSGLVLTEGKDLLLLMTNNDAPGQMTVYAFGQGRFLGAADKLHITLMQSVTAEEPVTLLPTSNEQDLQFIPEKSGTYSILTAYALDYLADLPESELIDLIVLQTDPYFYIEGEDVYDFSDDYDAMYQRTVLAAVTVELTAGTTYTIGVSSYGEAPFELLITREKKNLLDCALSIDGWGEAAEVTLNDENGNPLTEGKDYTLQTFDSDTWVYTVVRGIGDYYGTMYVESGDSQKQVDTYVDIALGEPFTFDPENAYYRLTVEEYCNVQLQVADTDYAQFNVYRHNEDGSLSEFSYYCTSGALISLDPGAYIIAFDNNNTQLTAEITFASVVSIYEASYEMEDMIYTGETLFAQPELYYDGALLVEGVDYVLTGAVSVVECGFYQLYVQGIGRFGDMLEIYYSVMPDPATATKLLYDGENEIVINKAGSTDIYKWVPEKSGEYAVASLDIYDVAIRVMDESGSILTEMKGYDEMYGFATVTAGKTYYITTAFSATDQTGGFTLLLGYGKRNLAACTYSLEDAYYVTGEAIVPKPEISYHGEKLVEGVDYTILTYGANIYAGIGVIELKGMGNYIGRLELPFQIYLENLNVDDIAAEEIIEAVLDEEYSYVTVDMDDTLLLKFTNTTKDTDVFHIELQDPDVVAVVQAYDAAGAPILDFDSDGFVLAEGETVYISLVSDRIWWVNESQVCVSIHAITDTFTVEHNGVFYLVDPDGNAMLTAVLGDRFVYEIEESFTYQGKQIHVVGCSEEISMYLNWNQQVFYVPATDDGVGLALLENGYVAVSLADTSTVAGDADGDGNVDLNDLLLLNGYVCEVAVVAEGNLANCDLNQDGVIDYNDIDMLLSNTLR